MTRVYLLDKYGQKRKADIDDIKEELDRLYELLLQIVGINDVIKTIVIYGESDQGEPYRLVIKY